jgi:predicted secreted protein
MFEQSIMKFSISCAAAAACLVFTVGAVTPAFADAPPPEGVLGLNASVSVEVVQDVLAVTFSTTREGTDANAVQSQLKQALDAAVTEAKKAARPGQLEVRTGNFSLYPRYANPTSSGRPTINGWQGSAEMIVEGRDMAAIGQLTGRITTMTIASVGYRLSPEASQRVEGDIVGQAIAAFRAKAASYAKLFGYGAYAVREVAVTTNEPQGGPIPRPRLLAANATAAEPLPVEPGKAVVTANVSGTIQMK